MVMMMVVVVVVSNSGSISTSSTLNVPNQSITFIITLFQGITTGWDQLDPAMNVSTQPHGIYFIFYLINENYFKICADALIEVA